MSIYLVTLVAVLTQAALKGSKVLIALYATELGADLFSIGLFAALYGLFPALLAVYAGKVSDRLGVWLPMVLGSFGLTLGLVLPALAPHLALLYLSPALIGFSHIFFQVSIQNLVGSLGDAQARVRNFGLYSLGAALSGFLGPMIAGFGIDHFGARVSYLVFAALALFSCLCLLFYRRRMPLQAKTTEPAPNQSVMDLVANAALRRVFITSGVILAGIDLFTFYFPIYGRSIGLSASMIGIILSMQAAAAFVVRTVMPWLVKRSSEETVLTYSLYVAGATYLLVPLFHHALILALISFILGLSLGCGQPLSVILTYNRAPAGRSGEALGARITVNKFTQVAIPVVFGALGASFGLIPVFWSNALFLLAGARLTAKPGERA